MRIIYGYDVAAFVFRYILFYVEHVVQAQHVQVIFFVDAHLLLQVVAHVIFINQGVGQTTFYALFGRLEQQQTVGCLIQFFH